MSARAIAESADNSTVEENSDGAGSVGFVGLCRLHRKYPVAAATATITIAPPTNPVAMGDAGPGAIGDPGPGAMGDDCEGAGTEVRLQVCAGGATDVAS